MERRLALGLGLVLLIGGVPVRAGSYQDPGGQGQPDAAPGAAAPARRRLAAGHCSPRSARARPPAEAPGAGQAVKPLTEGPLHEAFLSPRKDREPVHVAKAPPAPIVERPAVDPPSPQARVDRGLLGVGRRPQGLRLGDRHLAGPAAGPVLGQRLLEARRPGLVSRPGLLERPQDRPDRLSQERPARRPPRRRARRVARRRLLLHPRPVLLPTATASSGRRASGPRPSPAGPGSPRSGSASPKAGSSRKATGTAPSKTAAPSSPPPRSTSRPSTTATPSISPIPRSRPRATASSTGRSAGRTPTTTAIPASTTTSTAGTTATPTTATSAAITATSTTRTTEAMATRTMPSQ